MTFELTIFIVGALGIISTIIFKYLEIKHEKAQISGGFKERTDKVVAFYGNKIITSLKSVNRKNIGNLFVNLVHAIFVFWKNSVEKFKAFALKNKYIKIVADAVKGKYELNQKHEASDFLKQIEKDRDL